MHLVIKFDFTVENIYSVFVSATSNSNFASIALVIGTCIDKRNLSSLEALSLDIATEGAFNSGACNFFYRGKRCFPLTHSSDSRLNLSDECISTKLRVTENPACFILVILNCISLYTHVC